MSCCTPTNPSGASGLSARGPAARRLSGLEAQHFRLPRAGVHTALETCGWRTGKHSGSWSRIWICSFMTSSTWTGPPAAHGACSRRILDNLMALSREFPDLPSGAHPLIPGVNDGREQLSEIVQFLRRLPSLADYQLLPYHNWGREIPPAGPELSTGRTGAAGQGGGKAPQRRAAG